MAHRTFKDKDGRHRTSRPHDGDEKRPRHGTGRRAGQDERSKPQARRDEGLKIAGLPAVEALLARAPESIERLFFTEDYGAHLAPACRELSRVRKPYRMVGADELARIAGTKLNGGVVAVTTARPVPDFDANLSAFWARDGKPLLVLDGVGNPHNLGAIARTLAFFGVPRLLISSHKDQAGPSEAAIRVSEGGLIWTDLFRAPSMPDAIRALKPHFLVVGTALGRGTSLEKLGTGRSPHDKRALAFVLGNEERGLPDASLKACEAVVSLPGSGKIQSLNVAATAAILTHWALTNSR